MSEIKRHLQLKKIKNGPYMKMKKNIILVSSTICFSISMILGIFLTVSVFNSVDGVQSVSASLFMSRFGPYHAICSLVIGLSAIGIAIGIIRLVLAGVFSRLDIYRN